MRFLLCLLIWAVFVGGLALYTRSRDAAGHAPALAAPAVEQARQRIALELTPTFSVEDDPFALKSGEDRGPFELRLNGTALATGELALSRGQTMRLPELEFTPAAHNELFVKASPPYAESHLHHGIRVRLLDGDRTLADRTIWSSGGGLVSGTVPFSLQERPEDGHDHK